MATKKTPKKKTKIGKRPAQTRRRRAPRSGVCRVCGMTERQRAQRGARWADGDATICDDCDRAERDRRLATGQSGIVNGLAGVPHPYERFVTRMLGMGRKLELLAGKFVDDVGREGMARETDTLRRRVSRLRSLSAELDRCAEDVGGIATELGNSLPLSQRTPKKRS